MTESNTILIWVVLFRAMQTALEAVPTLLCGLFIAGMIRGMIGPKAVRLWFTDDARQGPVRAWFTGLLLPVCSFGVLPVAWELRRAGVPRGTVLTFLFAAPLANPFSLIDAFQRLEGEGALGLMLLAVLLIGSFVVLVGTGVLIGLWLPETIPTADVSPLPVSGFRRVGVVLLTVARGLNGILMLFLFIGIFGAGLLALISGGALERAINDRSVLAPLRLASVSIPFQATPTRGTVLICEAFTSGISVGSILLFYLLGIGLNLGTLVWVATSYGLRTLFCMLSIVVGCAVGIGYAIPVSLPNPASDGIQGCHFLEIESSGGYKVARARAIRATITDDNGQPQWFLIGACEVLGGFWLAGFVSSFLGDRGTISHVMTHGPVQNSNQEKSVWSKRLTAPQRTLAGAVVVLAGILAGLFIYYPAPSELLNQMDGVQIELALLLKSDPVPLQPALRATAQWQRLQNKLAVAELLRHGSIAVPVRSSTTRLRSAIDRLRAAIRDRGSPDELKPLYNEARDAAAHCREVLERGRHSAET